MFNKLLSPIAMHAAALVSPGLCSNPSHNLQDTVKPIEWTFTPNNAAPILSDKRKPVVREEPKQSRNSRCYCGSGCKYKRCCGRNTTDTKHTHTQGYGPY